jgi:hypothetical protein
VFNEEARDFSQDARRRESHDPQPLWGETSRASKRNKTRRANRAPAPRSRSFAPNLTPRHECTPAALGLGTDIEPRAARLPSLLRFSPDTIRYRDRSSVVGVDDDAIRSLLAPCASSSLRRHGRRARRGRGRRCRLRGRHDVDPRPRRKTRGRDGDIDPARPARFASSHQRVRAPGSVSLRTSRRRARLIPRRPGRGPRTPSASRAHTASPVELEPDGAIHRLARGQEATCRASRTNNDEELVGQRQPTQARRASAERTQRGQPSDVSNCSAAAPACEAQQKNTSLKRRSPRPWSFGPP